MKIIERLSEYIEFKHISLNSFDISIGASNGYIGKQIKNKASIGGDIIEKISSIYTDLNLTWLIAGEGTMLKEDGMVHSGTCGNCKVLETELSRLKEENTQLKDRLISTQEELIRLKDRLLEMLIKEEDIPIREAG